VSVNVSPVQFQSSGIDHDAWLAHLQYLQIRGGNVVVEITEGLLMDARPEITDQLLRFRDNGMQVALDDFGTGYSSLSYLKKFDIDYIKIDQAFVRNLEPGSDDLALCEAMIVMAHKLGLKVIAEGVETDAQRQLLAERGCDYAQGYLFSKPVPAAQFEALLRD
ncbi:MAG TPA: EAL domain-containing protein, partial [Noviherbaspirillum sp.]